MLEIGNGAMSEMEYKTHMSLWAILAAPLLAGNDLRSMSPEILAILTSRDVIAVNQDKLGKQGQQFWKSGDQEIWSRPLSDGAVAVAFFNRAAEPATISVKLTDLKLTANGKLATSVTSECSVHRTGVLGNDSGARSCNAPVEPLTSIQKVATLVLALHSDARQI